MCSPGEFRKSLPGQALAKNVSAEKKHAAECQM
jgi:hypothetical protein